MNSGKSAGTRSLLLLWSSLASSLWLRENASLQKEFEINKKNCPHLGEDQDVSSSKLLLEFTDKGWVDLVEGLELWDWDVDDDSRLVSNLDFLNNNRLNCLLNSRNFPENVNF